jgi:hypothetical protein
MENPFIKEIRKLYAKGYKSGKVIESARIGERLFDLTRDFTPFDFIECRKNRNWGHFDSLDDLDRLKYRLSEAKAYIRGGAMVIDV